MKTQKTIKQIQQFNVLGSQYAEKNAAAENKLCVAIKSILKKQMPKVFEEHQEDLDAARLSCCATGEHGVILYNAKGGYEYTPDGMVKFKQLHKEILKKQYTIHSRIPDDIDDLTSALTEDEKEAFSGFVIPELPTTPEETE